TGLYVAGTVEGSPLALPSGNVAGLAGLLEALAKVSDRQGVSFSALIAAQIGRLQHGTSAIAVAVDFRDAAVEALAELRRRHAVTALHIVAEEGSPPPTGLVDAVLRARYDEAWEQLEALELA
ncbi:MAG TPA: hypothetical protein VMD59_06945, partial [Acidimicrobiales bacterium]|nr:hypothetical protein [Acidimicrobiales bacterium]